MRITIYSLLGVLLLDGCAPTIVETPNPNIPFIYRNGFKNYSVKPLLMVENHDSTYINELRFNAVESAMYTQKLLYDRFGKWSEEINQPNYSHPTFLWKNIRLFKNKNKYFTVAANGEEQYDGIYASLMVYDSQNNDCLASDNADRESLIKYFSKGIKKLSSDEHFYSLWHQQFDEK